MELERRNLDAKTLRSENAIPHVIWLRIPLMTWQRDVNCQILAVHGRFFCEPRDVIGRNHFSVSIFPSLTAQDIEMIDFSSETAFLYSLTHSLSLVSIIFPFLHAPTLALISSSGTCNFETLKSFHCWFTSFLAFILSFLSSFCHSFLSYFLLFSL